MIMNAREAPNVSIIVAKFFKDPNGAMQVSGLSHVSIRKKYTSTKNHRLYGGSLIAARYRFVDLAILCTCW